MLWLLCGPSRAMESQALVIRIRIPDGGAVDWTVHSAPQLLFRDVLVSPGGGGRPGTGPGRCPGGDGVAGGDAAGSAAPSAGSGGEGGNKKPRWKAKGGGVLVGFFFFF